MDATRNASDPELELGGASPAAPEPAPEGPAPEAVAPEAPPPEAPPPEAPAASPPVPRAGSSASTRARVTNPKPKTGKRRRPKAAPAPVEAEGERVAVVLKTSRYTGRKGKAIARKTAVMVTVERGLNLIMLDHAREATEAEAAVAHATPVFLD